MARDQAYREAEERIREAQKQEARRLDLSDMELTEVPDAISSLTQLQSLDLPGNELTTLPDAISSLTQLQTLDLNYNQLTTLPDAISSLTQLQSLNLSENRLTTLPDAISSLTQLQTLDLNYNQLTTLPDAISSLTQLQTLDLNNNRLTTLPDAISSLTQLQSLDLNNNRLTTLPDAISSLTQLQSLNLRSNQLMTLPDAISSLSQLQSLDLSYNQLTTLPDVITSLKRLNNLFLSENKLTGLPREFNTLSSIHKLMLWRNPLKVIPVELFELKNLEELHLNSTQIAEIPSKISLAKKLKILHIYNNKIKFIPEEIGDLFNLTELHIGNSFVGGNEIIDLPKSMVNLTCLNVLKLDRNPLNPELSAAYKQGLESVLRYLQSRVSKHILLNEAKLILIGEGEVGKTCLLGALRGDEWEEGRPTTHGIEIKPVTVTSSNRITKITLNGWDFGGQRVYRPTHQLFFSAPAVYLVVWKPREGPQQGFVHEWIRLIKHREPTAKILVVATHGGPGQRQPDINSQDILDQFGRDTVLGFYHIDSQPDPITGISKGIEDLKTAIAQVAASLPEMGRTVPAKWQQARETLKAVSKAYLPLADVLAICIKQGIDPDQADLFIRISHELGHLIHYHYDPTLRDIVILKPDWLAKAISFVLDDETTRQCSGLVNMDRLNHLWNDPDRDREDRYPEALHPIFLKLMERFDLSYEVILDPNLKETSTTSLIAQLVPDTRPDISAQWPSQPAPEIRQQVQTCRIVETSKGQLAHAEGLFYQLIVRLHKYSLGRADYNQSIHWQRGLILDYDYNGRALLEHNGTDIKITVRAAFPERFLSLLTEEVKWLVESFWEGLQCNIMIPCLATPGCAGLLSVEKLIKSKNKGRPDYPCETCDEWQDINTLLNNAPIVAPQTQSQELSTIQTDIQQLGQVLVKAFIEKDRRDEERFQSLTKDQKILLSKSDQQFDTHMQMLTDEAKDGPRLFSIKPIDTKFLDANPSWVTAKFQITLWCEHSRLPLPHLNPDQPQRGVYKIELRREWLTTVTPWLKPIATVLSVISPIAISATKLNLTDEAYSDIQEQIDMTQKTLSLAGTGAKGMLSATDDPQFESGKARFAQGSVLRQLHALLKEKDPSFGGLERVQNKRRQFLWVHEQFVDEY